MGESCASLERAQPTSEFTADTCGCKLPTAGVAEVAFSHLVNHAREFEDLERRHLRKIHIMCTKLRGVLESSRV